MAVRYSCLCPLLVVLLSFLSLQPVRKVPTVAADQKPSYQDLGWVNNELTSAAHFDYVMSVRLRLLFFWAGKDNVGGGFIRHGIAQDNPRLEVLQVLFGSDPAKAPRAINRWGAGTEGVWHKNAVSMSSHDDDVEASTFFGFMKSSRGKSVSEMQEELRKEKDQGEHQFTGILSRVEPGLTTSLIVPLGSKVDYNLHQYSEAEPLMIERLNAAEKPTRSLPDQKDCQRYGEFLGTVSQLLNAEVENPQPGLALCYVYDAQVDKLVVEHVEQVPKVVMKINDQKGGAPRETIYNDLLQADFVTIHQSTGKKVYFTILAGRRGDMRMVPVQIRYQPNWWFQVILNLLPADSAETPSR